MFRPLRKVDSKLRKDFLAKEIFERDILTVNIPLIHFEEVHVILAYIQFMAVNVVFRSNENANNCLDILVTVDGDVIGKRLMIETILACLNHHGLSLLVTAYRYGVVDQRFKVIKESQ